MPDKNFSNEEIDEILLEKELSRGLNASTDFSKGLNTSNRRLLPVDSRYTSVNAPISLTGVPIREFRRVPRVEFIRVPRRESRTVPRTVPKIKRTIRSRIADWLNNIFSKK